MRLRCSSLPLIARCAAASVPPQVRIESVGVEARVGTAVHACLRAEVEGRDWSARDHALAHGVDPEEVGALAGAGVYCWQQLRQWFPRAEAEVELHYREADCELTGHADVFSLTESAGQVEVRVADWKSGRMDADAEDQLRGYALCAVESYHAETAQAFLVRLRDRSYDNFVWTRDDLRAWFAGLLARTEDQELYRPGRWCGYCPRQHECPGRRQWVESAMQALLCLNEPPLESSLEPGQWGAWWGLLHERRQTLQHILDTVAEMERAVVSAAGGTLPTVDGWALELRQQERRGIEYPAAAAILVERLGREKVESLLKIGKGDVEDAIRATAGRGHKLAAVRELFDRLDEAGAITTKVIERLELRKLAPQVEVLDDGSGTNVPALADATG